MSLEGGSRWWARRRLWLRWWGLGVGAWGRTGAWGKMLGASRGPIPAAADIGTAAEAATAMASA